MLNQTVSEHAPMPAWKKVGALAAGLGAGAVLMYLADPQRGRARRARIREQAFSAVSGWREDFTKRLRDGEHRLEGAVAEIRRRLEPAEDVSDRRLEARVHTRLGRVAARPRAVRVMALGGKVIVGGTVAAEEIGSILEAIREVPGVREVQSLLVAAAADDAAAVAGARAVR